MKDRLPSMCARAARVRLTRLTAAVSVPRGRNLRERSSRGESHGTNATTLAGLRLSLQSPNDAVSVLEEPRESHAQQQGKSNYFIKHADLGP
ncbi:hypothetical protein AAFF_G00321890 [Aldrovandia affinis]|uniref:Uncharacterized protein n=1 Tax=Aldrovandia affinis TaxID=143900 RepID=A0AAD7SN01_9TELE|nr:hypothetical protein AAFF_G00321890 [Aldrovandia affinis]